MSRTRTGLRVAMAAGGLGVALTLLRLGFSPGGSTDLTSPASLPADQQPVVRLLLLLPVGLLVVGAVRQFVGLTTFGTFAPALLGIAFAEMSGPAGFFVFGFILALGWLARDLVEPLQLLRVPRSGVLLTVVVIGVVGLVLAGNALSLPVGESLAMLPLVILAGLVERFWLTDEEDSGWESVKTLACTLLTAGAVYAATSPAAVGEHLMHFPETLLILVGGLIGLGRYTGYRLVELFRFGDLGRAERRVEGVGG